MNAYFLNKQKFPSYNKNPMVVDLDEMRSFWMDEAEVDKVYTFMIRYRWKREPSNDSYLPFLKIDDRDEVFKEMLAQVNAPKDMKYFPA